MAPSISPSATSIAPLQVRLNRAHGRATHTPPQLLPEEGAVLGSEGLLREYMGSGLFVARTHAQILPLCGHWMLIPNDPDLLCVLNGHRLPWGKPHALTPGDTLQIGFTEVIFSLPAREEYVPGDHAATEGLPPHTASPTDPDVPASPASPPLKGTPLPPAPPLPAHKQLMAQLAADFAASESGRALCCQQGEALDHILTPSPEPVPLPQDASATCPPLPLPAAPALPDQHKAFFLEVGKPFDMDAASTLATPPPQEGEAPRPRPSLPTANEGEKSGELSAAASPETLGALEALGALAAPEPTAPASGHMPPHSPRTLEEILHGPLSIDDVLHWLDADCGDETGLAPMAALESLESIPAPDPLALLEHMTGATQSNPPSPYPWPHSRDGLSGLSPLLQQEHHRADMHTSFSLRGDNSPAPIPPKNREAS